MEHKIGSCYQLPSEKCCGHVGRIAWISKDGKTIGVRCPKTHYADPFDGKPYPDRAFSYYIGKRNTVYLIGVE